MDKTNQAEEKPVTDTQDSAMPTEDQKTTVTESTQEAAPTEVSSKETESEGLPDSASDRTKREFEKLKNELREERRKRQYVETVFNGIQQKQAPQQEVPQPVPVYDPNTGLLNEQALNEIQQRTIQAEQRAQTIEQRFQQMDEERKAEAQRIEEQEAFTAHPELNPESKSFDQTLHNITSSLMLKAMLEPDKFGGKQLSFKEAGDTAKEWIQKVANGAKKTGAQEALTQLTPKEQAALEAVGNPTRRTEVGSNLDDLRYRTRKGDIQSIVERLKGTG